MVHRATIDDCDAIDDVWPALRKPSDVHHVWRWAEMFGTLKECFVVRAGDSPVAIWGSTPGRPIVLTGSPYFRLDYLEIDPRHRDEFLGPFLVGVIASRALELGCVGMVLTSFPVPGLVEFYEGTGAARGAPKGWNHPKELVPLTFELSALQRLKGVVDVLLEEEQA